MSTAATADAVPAAKGRGKKKLVIAAAALAVLLAGGGGGAFVLMKKKAHAEAEADGDAADGHGAAAKTGHAGGTPPVFVPLDSFTVNLADRDNDRYAQVGITLEIADPKLAETIKVYMPAIRNRVLMAIADRTAAELLGREGKARLAERIKRETSVALGHDVPDEDEDAPKDAEPAAPRKAKAKTRSRQRAEPALPVRAVHFSSFIVQ